MRIHVNLHFKTSLVVVLALVPLWTSPATAEQATAKAPAIYDESGNGEKLLAKALEQANKNHTNVLVQFGGNWCGWCVKLHGIFASDKDLSKVLKNEYTVVNIDTNSNPELYKRLDSDAGKHGVPFLVVLGPDGKTITTQATGEFEINGNAHDPKKLLAFLEKFKPKPLAAQEQFDKALGQAKQKDKKLMVRFGAPWCGWCNRLDAFLNLPEVASILDTDYVLVKIDMDRMEGAKPLYERYCKNPGGIPWYAILDSDGKTLTTSDAPSGNIGYPGEPAEIAYFMKMISSTKKAMTPEQLKSLDGTLQRLGQEIKSSH